MTQFCPSPLVRAVGRALPPHYADQETLIGALRGLWKTQHFNVDRLEELHRSVQVSGRYLALPIEEYDRVRSFEERNDVWIRVAQDVGEDAVRRGLSQAGLAPEDVDHLIFVTVTGVATPSIDARLMNR